MIKFPLNTKKVITVLCIVFAVLFALNLATMIQGMFFIETIKKGAGHYFYTAFHFNVERNIPTYFSSILLFLSSQTFFFINLLVPAQTSSYIKYYWLQMSLIFLLLSMDEIIQLHERMTYLTVNYTSIEVDGFLWSGWIVPMFVLLVILGLYSIKFLMYVPKYLSKGYIISGSMYVIGAIGMQMIGGKIFSITNNEQELYYYIAITFEESLEMTGIITLLYFNLKYIEELNTSTS